MGRNADAINVTVTFRKTESTPALKQHAIAKLTNVISKYVKRPTEVEIVLLVEKRDHIVEVKVVSKSSRDYDLTAKAVTEDLYSAIDKVADIICAQLRKRKEKSIESQHPKPVDELE